MENRYVVFGTLVCASLALTLLVMQWHHIRSVTVELMDLERRVRALQKGQELGHEGVCCPSHMCCGVWVTPEFVRSRGKRDVSSQKKPRQKRQTGDLSSTDTGLLLIPSLQYHGGIMGLDCGAQFQLLLDSRAQSSVCVCVCVCVCMYVCVFVFIETEQRSFLHLIPASTHSNDDRDVTVLTWTLGRSQGAGLQVSGESITVLTRGNYFVYSQNPFNLNSYLLPCGPKLRLYLLQVLYTDTTWVMGHVITKRLNGTETKLMKCLKSMPNNDGANTCYTAGIHFLESGSVLELSIPRKSAELSLAAHATFLGIFSI
ncbi:hypothetical protein NFI96_013566 [Prochilodus magdalenae]|nr:hypothetical protein NFI96_013566 [Prochilodus magdalenae]